MTESGGMSTGQKFVGVLTAPTKTFESIARHPSRDWLVPFAILILLVIIGAVFVSPKVDVDDAINQVMKKMEARGNATPQQLEQTEKMVRGQYEFMTKGPGRFFTPLFVIIPVFFVPAVYHLTAKAFGAGTRYMTVVAGYAWIYVVQIIKGVIGLAVAMSRPSIDVNEAQNLVKSNLGAFLDTETASPALKALAGNIDLFEIWCVILASIMLWKCTRLSRKAATVTVVTVWILWVLFQVAGGALQGAFGG